MKIQNKLKINLILSLISTAIQFVQSLWVTSYVQRCMGVEAYGYIAVVVNLVQMTGIVSVALTSVCSRYVVVELEKGDKRQVNTIFSTMFYALFMVAVACVGVFCLVIANLPVFINVSDIYIGQVSWLMFIVSLEFAMVLVQVPFLSLLFYEEKLYYNYVVTILSNVFKVIVVIVVFEFLSPAIWGAHLGALFAHLGAIVVYVFYLRKHYSYITIGVKYFKFSKLKEVLISGVWVSVSKLAATLISTCSTYMVNILAGVYLAGIYGAIAQIQSILSVITVAIVNVFLPGMYKKYAANQISDLIEYTKSRTKVISIILGIVSGGLIIFGGDFMALWISAEYRDYTMLLAVSVVCLPIAYSSEMLNQLLIVVDKTKVFALMSIVAGVCNVVLAVLLVRFTPLGIYGVTIAQVIVLVFRSWLYLSSYTAKMLQQKWYCFCTQQLHGVVSMAVTALLGGILSGFVTVNSWLVLIVVCGVTGGLSGLIMLILYRDLRDFLKSFVKR